MKQKLLSMLVLLAAVVTGAVAQETYKVSVKEGTEDATNWTIAPAEATTTGVAAGTQVTATYSGTKKVKSVKAVKKAAPAPALNLTSPAVGQVIGDDGKNYDYASLPGSVTAVAMIAKVSGTSGLAIALADEGSLNWETAKSTCEAKTPAFTGGTWKLPTQDEWKQMFSANGGSETSYSGLNTAIGNAGGTALQEYVAYWSSTENGSDNAYGMFLEDGNAYFGSDSKVLGNRVRACLAFTVEAPAGPTAYTLAESTLGMVVGTDGKAYAMADKDNLPTGVTAAGVVAYKDGTSGLVIALTDEASTMDWSTACGASGAAAHTPAVEGQSWKLPSQEDWQHIGSVYNGTDLNTAIVDAGGTAILTPQYNPDTGTMTNIYWLSTENPGNTAQAHFGYNINGYIGAGDADHGPKTEAVLVRAVLAFTVESSAGPTYPLLSAATTDDLGKIAGANGKIYDTKDAATAAGTTAVAMIAYVGNGTDHATYTHGLAIALEDEAGSLDWPTAKSTCEGKIAVADAAWVLPSQNQWKAMFNANGGSDSNYSGLNTAITNAGGTALDADYIFYWSSTENGANEAWGPVFTGWGPVEWWSYNRGPSAYYGYKVRACLAF